MEQLIGSDLPTYIGKNELFETNATQIADIHCVLEPACVMTLKEYVENPSDSYYSRAFFDSFKSEFTPPFEKWDKLCI